MRSLNMTSRNVIAVLVGALVALPMAARAATTLQITINPPLTAAKNEAPIHYGETLTYEAVIANLGPANATVTQVTAITIDPGLVLKNISGCTPVGTNPLPCVVDPDGLISPEVGTDPTKFQFTKSVTFDVELPMPKDADGNDALPTACPNGVPVFSPIVVDVVDHEGDTATQSDTPVIGNWADLGVAMSAPGTSSIGATFDVSVTVTNHGPCDAAEVYANDSDPNFAQGSTSLGLEFLSADGDCTVDPTGFDRTDPKNTSCYWPTLAAAAGANTKTWTVHYRVANFPNGLMQADEDVSYTVYSKADTAFDYNADNDVDRTKTIVKKHRANCSTGGGMGQALSLLVLAVPFLRRRRKS